MVAWYAFVYHFKAYQFACYAIGFLCFDDFPCSKVFCEFGNPAQSCFQWRGCIIYIVKKKKKGNSSLKELVIKAATIRDQYSQAFTLSLKRKIGNEMQQLFFELTAASLKMMNREEMIVNDLLWTNYSDSEIQELEKRMTAPSFKIEKEVAAVEPKVATEVSLSSVNITPLISLSDRLPVSEKLSMLIRRVLAPGKWRFANRVYNIIRPHHLFGIMPAIICTTMFELSA